MLNKAYKQAAREKKNVFVIFHASYCGWCRKLDASINDPLCSTFFSKSYVFVHVTADEAKEKKDLENPGGDEMLLKYAGTESGVPFFIILDRKGALLADSKLRKAGDSLDKPGENIGCPASDEEVAAFINILRKTSKITDQEADAVSARFKKNRN